LAIGTSVSYVALNYIEVTPGELNQLFNKFDYTACCLFLFIYILKWYVATHRIQYLLSLMSLLDLFIMLPTLILIEPTNDKNTYFLIPFSRFLRAMTFVIILSRYFKLGQTDVDRQINIVFMTMVLLTYISSGMYAIVENSKRESEFNYL